MLSEKYAPNTLNGIMGNDSAVAALEGFAQKVHSNQKPKPLILFGPPGTGKTAAARALAYGNSFELLELTASDYRDADSLNRTVIPASRSKGLFGRTILILLDEIDELSKKYDTGVERVLGQLLRETKQPVIFTAEDYWDQNIRFLRGLTDKVEFKKVGEKEIAGKLREIASKENAAIEKDIIESIAKRSNGDVRGAINDMEVMVNAPRELMENIGMRDNKVEIFGVLDKIFLSGSFDVSRNALAKSSVDTDMVLNWIDENIPTRYTSKEEIQGAYESLALASRFYEKAQRTNNYGYLRYASVLMSAGVAVHNYGYVRRLRQYSFPLKIRHLGNTKQERSEASEVAEKLFSRLHTNKKRIIREYMPLLKVMFRKSVNEMGREKAFSEISSATGLEESDIDFILGAG